MRSIIAHLRIIIKDIREKGLFLAFSNAVWFVRKLLPQSLFLIIIKKKHCVVKKKISEIVGSIDDLQLPPINKLKDFED